jgi:hypothetical protein
VVEIVAVELFYVRFLHATSGVAVAALLAADASFPSAGLVTTRDVFLASDDEPLTRKEVIT